MRRRLRNRGRDEGVTLAELLVAMTITVVFFSVFSSIAVKMLDSTNNQQSRSDNLDTTRNVVEVLDRQVRYANAIGAPEIVNGSQYVSWRSGSITGSGAATATTSANPTQTCYQWRVTAAGRMQYRSWKLPDSSATGWTTAGNGIGPVVGAGIFSIAVPAGLTQQNRQQLTLSFASTHGTKAVSTPTRLAFTALNTRTSSAPATPVCREVLPE